MNRCIDHHDDADVDTSIDTFVDTFNTGIEAGKLGMSMLHYFVYKNDHVAVSRLLKNKIIDVNIMADCNITIQYNSITFNFNRQYMSPIYLAIAQDNCDMIRTLIHYKSNINQQCHAFTPLKYAATFKNYKIMELLLANKATSVIESTESMLMTHITTNKDERAAHILVNNHYNLAKELEHHYSNNTIFLAILVYNVLKHNPDAIRMFLDYGITTMSNGKNPSSEAVKYALSHSDNDMLELMFNHGFEFGPALSVFKPSSHTLSPKVINMIFQKVRSTRLFNYACDQSLHNPSYMSIMKQLSSKITHLDRQTNQIGPQQLVSLSNPLWNAISIKHYRVIQSLLQFGANPNITVDYRMTSGQPIGMTTAHRYALPRDKLVNILEYAIQIKDLPLVTMLCCCRGQDCAALSCVFGVGLREPTNASRQPPRPTNHNSEGLLSLCEPLFRNVESFLHNKPRLFITDDAIELAKTKSTPEIVRCLLKYK